MNDTTTIDHVTGNPVVPRENLQGVRRARVFGFLIDYAIIALLCVPFGLLIGLLGVLTLGLAWTLYGILPLVVAALYLAFTLGGPNQATIGMRMMGVKIMRLEGGTVDPILAVLHGLLFWVIHSVAVILPLFVTFFSSKKRLLHDVLLGTYVSRA